MKATDLMIGDWVYTNRDYMPIAQVETIYSHSVFTKDGEYEGEEIKEEDIKPIPLTPEILEKNGFPYDNKERLYYPFSGKAFAIERDEHDDQVFYYSMYVYNPYGSFNWHEIIEIRYVHELQHALKLCGIDKQITL